MFCKLQLMLISNLRYDEKLGDGTETFFVVDVSKEMSKLIDTVALENRGSYYSLGCALDAARTLLAE